MCQKIKFTALKKTALFLALSTFLFGCSSSSDSTSVLRVGVSADFAPICFIDEGKLQGFDIDLMNEIAQRMGKQVQWSDLPFDTLIPELITGKVHLVVGGMSPSKERGEKVLFSRTYLQEGSIVALMRKDSVGATSQEWEDSRIVVCMGYTTSDDYVTKHLSKEPIRLPNLIDCVLALRAQQADVLVGPCNTIEHLIKQDKDQWTLITLKSNPQEGSVCLISKRYPYLQKPINEALEAMESEGVIQKLKLKWALHD